MIKHADNRVDGSREGVKKKKNNNNKSEKGKNMPETLDVRTILLSIVFLRMGVNAFTTLTTPKAFVSMIRVYSFTPADPQSNPRVEKMPALQTIAQSSDCTRSALEFRGRAKQFGQKIRLSVEA